jgi:hypothetical protein
MNLKDKIEKARAEAKEIERKRPPEPTLKVKGFWQKKSGEGDTHSSFVAKVTGIGYDAERDRETLTLDFADLYSEIQWTGKKGANPEGIKTWYLPEGIYKARLFASQSQKEPDWKLFAVVEGKEEPLTEAEVFHIFQDGSQEEAL